VESSSTDQRRAFEIAEHGLAGRDTKPEEPIGVVVMTRLERTGQGHIAG
jgi:hypothetical protein